MKKKWQYFFGITKKTNEKNSRNKQNCNKSFIKKDIMLIDSKMTIFF